MGIFDFLKKDNSEEGWAKKQSRRLMNKYGQKEVREDAMYALYQRGTPEAISGLLQRFTFDHPESIVDEREKNKVIELLDHLGAERASGPLRAYLADEKQTTVSMALIALDTLEGEEATVLEIIKLLNDADPNDAWGNERKLQLIGHLDEVELDPETMPDTLVPMLVSYLQDLNDDVIFRCVDLLERLGTDEQIRSPMVDLLVAEDTSARIRARIIDTCGKRKWYLGDRREELEGKLPDGYYFDKRNNLKYRDPYA